MVFRMLALPWWSKATWAVTKRGIAQLGWVGNSSYPLWALVIVGLNVMVIFALTVRWEGYPDQARTPSG